MEEDLNFRCNFVNDITICRMSIKTNKCIICCALKKHFKIPLLFRKLNFLKNVHYYIS